MEYSSFRPSTIRDSFLWQSIKKGIYIFSTGFSVPSFTSHDFSLWLQMYAQLALPILTWIITGFGYWVLVTRNLVVDSLTQAYMVTARAEGLNFSYY